MATMNASSTWHCHFGSMARYHVWATHRLLEAVSRVSAEDYQRDVGLFFKSIHGTLNHMLVAEHLLWYARFAKGASPVLALNSEIEPDRQRLAQALKSGSANWTPLIASWPAERFDGHLDYRTSKGAPLSLPFSATLAHVFNHATHHRGQITAALTYLGYDCPELDMVYFLLAEQAPKA